MKSQWSRQVNAAVGSVIVTFGLWLIWGEAPVAILAAVALGLGALLAWGSVSLPAVWAWTTALLGLESFAWAVIAMIQGKLADRQPTEEEMVAILTAVLFGLFSSIFWLTFSYGIFKKFVRAPSETPSQGTTMRSKRDSD